MEAAIRASVDFVGVTAALKQLACESSDTPVDLLTRGLTTRLDQPRKLIQCW
jgi:hypothetical protein